MDLPCDDELPNAARDGELDLGLIPELVFIPSHSIGMHGHDRFCEWNSFLNILEDPAARRRQRRERFVAFLEIQSPDVHRPTTGWHIGDPLANVAVQRQILSEISASLSGQEVFSWFEGRFIILMASASPKEAHRRLRGLLRRLSSPDLGLPQTFHHLTPAIGYTVSQPTISAQELCQRAEVALASAKASLEIEPLPYSSHLITGGSSNPLSKILALWATAPQLLVLSVQVGLSLILGLGAPFLIYATFDALGLDISGLVYVGVVIVLLVTASTIWLEGILAFLPTDPPAAPGSDFPIATVIIPAYLPNEAATIVETLDAFLRLDYPNTVQVIVAYNLPGARMPVEDELDAIAAREAAIGRFIIEPIRVHGSTSKAQNVNAVIGRAQGAFVGIFDADHHPLPDSLRRAWRWLSNGWDIVQGRCSIRNGNESWVARMVAIEFEQIYAVSHPGRARLHGFGIFGGSNGFWRTSVLHQTRMRHSMLTEDIDSSIRAVEAGYKIAGDRDLISEELAPTSLRQLLNQRLRWAQGWFQVSIQRIIPALISRKVTLRQKLGLVHLLVWRELFPWYSIQVIPILAYWIWAYGWSYISWTVPIFLFTSIFTLSTGPGQLLFAYLLSRKVMRQRRAWFLEYLFASTLFYAPFKDALSRISHLKEAMRERTWRVTPRIASIKVQAHLASAVLAAFALSLVSISGAKAGAPVGKSRPSGFAVLIGGEVSTIRSAREAAKENRNADAAKLFEQAIAAVPRRRSELLREYADALSFSGRSRDAVPLYREMIVSRSNVKEQVALQQRLAEALAMSGQYREARAAYDELLKTAPDNIDLIIHRARMSASLGLDSEALADLERVPAARWPSGQLGEMGDGILVESARKAAAAGRNTASAELFERAISRNPKLRPSLLREYANQLLAAHKSTEALTLYQEAVNASPTGLGSGDAKLGLVKALQEAGRPKEAYDAYLSAIADSSRQVINAKATGDRSHRASLEAVLNAKGVPSSDILAAARMASSIGRSNESAMLFKKAASDCPRCEGDVLLAYADQLSASSKGGLAVAEYREVLAHPSRGGASLGRAERGLALALTRNNEPREAVAAWTSYLSLEPRDADAIVQKAQLLSGLQDEVGALAAYQAALTIDPHSVRARRGAFDETVASARLAAQQDKNGEAAKMFSTAIALNPSRGPEVAREYADQLSFSGHVGEAVSLYQSALSEPSISVLDRKRATTMLASAYVAVGRPDDALATLMVLRSSLPEDVEVEWTVEVFKARQEARHDNNKESAALFERALKISPDRGDAIRREYADQLSFSGNASEAIIQYRQAIDSGTLSAADDDAAKKGLGDAYAWAGRQDQAAKVFDQLFESHPNDAGLRWMHMVADARLAAHNNKNQDSAVLFAEAVQLDASRSDGILREFADQLSFSGRSNRAVSIYVKLLSLTDLSASDRLAARKGLAQAYEWSGCLVEAKTAFSELVAENPDDKDLRWKQAVVSARAAGVKDQNKEAAQFFEAANELIPGRRDSILREYADKLTFSGEPHKAVPLYRELVAKSTQPSDRRSREMDLARALLWDHQPEAAVKIYEGILKASPDDFVVKTSMAQVLSWSGRQIAARAAYREVLAVDPGNADGMRGLAQVEDWQGHHRAAEAILIRRLEADPNDLQARRLLAQSQVWLGRPDKAQKEVTLALEPKFGKSVSQAIATGSSSEDGTPITR